MREREYTEKKNPQDLVLGLETGVTGSPFPPHQAGGQRTLGNTRLQTSPDIRTLVRVPTFGSWSPNAPLQATAADNFSEITKPVWIKQEST